MKKGSVFWITGLSGAGKSTLSKELQTFLKMNNIKTIILDGDELREILNKNSYSEDYYSREMRLQLAMQYSKLAHLLSSQGLNVIVATISMFNEVYQLNRSLMENYVEIFMDTPIEVLRNRDPKGIYQKQLKGDLKGVAGVDLRVDIPSNPHVTISYKSNSETSDLLYKIFKTWAKQNDH